MARKFEVAILTGLFITTVVCFSIPVVIYATSSLDAGTNAALIKLTEHFDINECPQKVRLILASYRPLEIIAYIAIV